MSEGAVSHATPLFHLIHNYAPKFYMVSLVLSDCMICCRWGNKRFKADPDMLAKRDRMLDKYPLPESWLEVADPQ